MEPTSDEALLTAYLAGELSSEEREHLEQRLADDPELRQRLTLLDETWHYLDLLEQEEVDAEEIEATLEIAAVSLSAVPFLPPGVSRWGKRGIALLVAMALLVGSFHFGNRAPYDEASVRKMGEEERKKLAEILEQLPAWHKESLLKEEPNVIFDELRQLWNAH